MCACVPAYILSSTCKCNNLLLVNIIDKLKHLFFIEISKVQHVTIGTFTIKASSSTIKASILLTS